MCCPKGKCGCQYLILLDTGVLDFFNKKLILDFYFCIKADAITMKSPLEDIKTILRCGANVNEPVKKGLRPLHYAAYVDYVECVCMLIDEGAKVNISDDIGFQQNF
jgi:ankyrin repeat protein